ncbi:E3 ubiquitin-protein ligase RING1-like [Brachypodium distachyon]|uniref:RING-type domain-containing protein n=1 Tax=Brachypodium distachyon TaxID=15368 RepID=I1GS15_BRADI|nr:E3 ubiquitin-protein ligase RING1-like [Brachypodium distachyon]KQK15074.1 hypothetical protein BRADI_1g20480v3 [Brachypodium distachyon]|eukprot:XP_003562628.1 E3 ubiquitin-protein ligase RING1-like [Brachypodium distachyon]
MASAENGGGDSVGAGILRLLMGMAASPGGVMMVHHVLVDGDGELFSGGLGGAPPASKAAIASLKEAPARGGSEDCAICLDAFEAGKEMPCGHRFHGGCLERWLGVHGSCPVCRSKLPKADPAEQDGGGGGEGRRPRGALLVTYVALGGGGDQSPREEEEQSEQPWNIRVEDVD